MFSSVSTIAVLVLAVSSSLVAALPSRAGLHARQLGNLQCNVNRLGIVQDVSQLSGNIDDLSKAVGDDPTMGPLVESAHAGVNNCTDGIQTIAKAIFSGQQAPSSARDQVAAGLETIGGALNQINSTDSSVTTPLSAAQTNLQKAITNGENVVADCK